MGTTACCDAWVKLPREAEARLCMPPGYPYDFGFIPAMMRLVLAHDEIAPAFAALFGQIMFASGRLNRREREMVAAVATAAQDCHY